VRKILFWLHLVAGVVAGAVILVMSATGVLLTYEKQMLAWSDRTAAAQPPDAAASRRDVDALIAAARAVEGAEPVTGISMSSVAGAPALVTRGQRTIAVNAYTGAVIGDASPRLRAFFRGVTSWHRWLGVDGPGRTLTRAITGWSSLLFVVLIVSGPFLWLPRVWTTARLRAITFFRGGLRGKARDFNWHNVIGIWSFVPLLIVMLGALPISFPWANAAVYRLAGEAPPAAAARPRPAGPEGPRGAAAAEGSVAPVVSLSAAWAVAERHVADWRAISLRMPANAKAPLTFTIDRGTGGQPQLRGTLTVDRATTNVVRWETFDAQTAGRRLRSFARFAHTGEVFGLPGQTIAGLASAGAVVLVWTGLALALRRFAAWRKRRSADLPAARERAA
jgi:uncharacterized iron-regulated membrane protein